MSSHRSAGRSKPAAVASSMPAKLTLSTRNLRSHSSLSRDEDSSTAASPSSPDASRRSTSRQNLRNESMMTPLSTYSSSSPLGGGHPSKPSTTGGHAKLHKRGGSGSSLPGPPSTSTSQYATPFATYEEPFPDISAQLPSASGVPKIKSYSRKKSSAKEDQGMIDLSKSVSENDRLAGLGIHDFSPKTVADVSFTHSRRGHQHARTASVGSQISTGSGGVRPGQTFTHPMTKTPRPYTPPTGSYANSLIGNEADETDDVVDDDFKLGGGFRTRRSMSVSSANPTPLSQSHTVSDLPLLPNDQMFSHPNISVTSTPSHDRSPKSSKSRSRRNTDLSQEYNPSPPSRTSLDKAFGLVSTRKSDATESQSRDERIRAARQKFEEKEAHKDRKYEKRRDPDPRRARQKSDAPPLKSALKQSSKSSTSFERRRHKPSAATASAGVEDEKQSAGKGFRAIGYTEHPPPDAAFLPCLGSSPGESERRLTEKGAKHDFQPQPMRPKPSPRDGGWLRFSTWLQTRMLSCGGRRD